MTDAACSYIAVLAILYFIVAGIEGIGIAAGILQRVRQELQASRVLRLTWVRERRYSWPDSISSSPRSAPSSSSGSKSSGSSSTSPPSRTRSTAAPRTWTGTPFRSLEEEARLPSRRSRLRTFATTLGSAGRGVRRISNGPCLDADLVNRRCCLADRQYHLGFPLRKPCGRILCVILSPSTLVVRC